MRMKRIKTIITILLSFLFLSACSFEPMFTDSEVDNMVEESYLEGKQSGYDDGYDDGVEFGYDEGYYHAKHDLEEYNALYAEVYYDVCDDIVNEIFWSLDEIEVSEDVYHVIYKTVMDRADAVIEAQGPILPTD